MTEGWVDYLTGPWGFAFAFAAGVLSFLSPCVLPLVPVYLAHLTGTAISEHPEGANRRATVSHAVAFVLGFTAVFTVLGASVGLLGAAFGDDNGYFIRDHQTLLMQIGGVFLIVMGLNLIGVIRIPLLYRSYTLEPATAGMPAGAGGGSVALGASRGAPGALTYGKSFGVGAAFAVGWTPCIGPILGSILTYAAPTGSPGIGATLLFTYSLGLGIPFLLAGLFLTRTMGTFRWLRDRWTYINAGAAAVFVAIGFLVATGRFEVITQQLSGVGFNGI